MEWRATGTPGPLKARTQRSVLKVLLTVFWDHKGMLLANYLPHGQSITGQYYAVSIDSLRAAVKEKRRGSLTRQPLLLHDNAPVHKSAAAQAAIREAGFRQLDHLPYSPDLAHSDFPLFPNLKKAVRGRRFASLEELQGAIDGWLEDCHPNFFRAGIEACAARWHECILLREVMLKNYKNWSAFACADLPEAQNF